MTASPVQDSPAALAAKYGLIKSTARPSLPTYLQKLWDRRQFIIAYAAARSDTRYSQSRLGGIWALLTPIINAAVYYTVFGLLLGMHRGIADFPAFLVTGVFVFTFLQRSMNNGAKSISGNLQLIRALHFPRAVLPLSFVLVEFKQLVYSMLILFVFIAVVGEPITAKWLLVVPAMLIQMLFNIGLSLIMARIGAGSSDINQLLPFITRIWLYLSGVFYSITRWTDKAHGIVRNLLTINPGGSFLELYRLILIKSHNRVGEALVMPWGLNVWEVCIGWTIIVLFGGFVFFWRAEERYGRG